MDSMRRNNGSVWTTGSKMSAYRDACVCWETVGILQTAGQLLLVLCWPVLENMFDRSEKFVGQSIGVQFCLGNSGRQRFTILVPFQKMQMEIKRHVADQRMHVFTVCRRTFAIERLQRGRSQPLRNPLPYAPVIPQGNVRVREQSKTSAPHRRRFHQ